MSKVICDVMPAPARSRRLWMMLAFIAGIIFTAVMLQTLAAAQTVFPAPPGKHDSLTPVNVPADGYLVKIQATDRFVPAAEGRQS